MPANAFGGYMGKQRKSVQTSYDQALADLQRREQGGMANLAGLPGQVRKLYGEAGAQFDQFGRNALDAVAARGMDLKSANADYAMGVAPLKWAQGQAQAGALGQQKFLEQGLGEQMTRERGAAGATKAAMMSELAAQEAQHIAQQEQMARSEAMQREEMSQRERMASADRAAQQGGGTGMNELDLYAAKKAIDAEYGKEPTKKWGASDIGADRGAALSPRKRDEIKRAPEYQSIYREVAQMAARVAREEVDPVSAMANLRKRFGNRPMALSLALHETNI